jgi:hypothetical protein
VEVLVGGQSTSSFQNLWLEFSTRELVIGKKNTKYNLGHWTTEALLISRLPFDDIVEVRRGVVSNAVDIMYNRTSNLVRKQSVGYDIDDSVDEDNGVAECSHLR